MPTPLRSVRLSDEAWDFLEGLKVVYGTADKGMLAISRICTPEVLAADTVMQDKPKARAESVAERKAREQKEHVAKLAESDVLARAVGRDDIEYDPENSPHRAGPLYIGHSAPSPKPNYQVIERKCKPLTRPCGTTASKKSKEQKA